MLKFWKLYFNKVVCAGFNPHRRWSLFSLFFLFLSKILANHSKNSVIMIVFQIHIYVIKQFYNLEQIMLKFCSFLNGFSAI